MKTVEVSDSKFLEDFKNNLALKTLAAGFVRATTVEKYDLQILVDGKERKGKSKFVLGLIFFHILPRLGIKVTKENIVSLVDQVVELSDSMSLLLRKLAIAKKGFPCDVDEAVYFISKMDFAKKNTENLKKTLTSMAYKNRIVFWIIPNLNDVLSNLMDRRITDWIHVFDRGKIIYFAASENFMGSDAWFRKISEKDIGTARSWGKVVAKCRRNPSFVSAFTFPDWDPDEKHPLWLLYIERKEYWDKRKHGKLQKSSSIEESERIPIDTDRIDNIILSLRSEGYSDNKISKHLRGVMSPEIIRRRRHQAIGRKEEKTELKEAKKELLEQKVEV